MQSSDHVVSESEELLTCEHEPGFTPLANQDELLQRWVAWITGDVELRQESVCQAEWRFSHRHSFRRVGPRQ